MMVHFFLCFDILVLAQRYTLVFYTWAPHPFFNLASSGSSFDKTTTSASLLLFPLLLLLCVEASKAHMAHRNKHQHETPTSTFTTHHNNASDVI